MKLTTLQTTGISRDLRLDGEHFRDTGSVAFTELRGLPHPLSAPGAAVQISIASRTVMWPLMPDRTAPISLDRRERQSEVARSGAAWERYVADYLRGWRAGRLQSNEIEIIDGAREREIREDHERLFRLLRIPVVNHRYDRAVWGDIDLIASIRDVPVAIISCKTSLHGRLTETLFYSLLYRAVKNLRVVFVTPDRGRQGGHGWQSEWGSPGSSATKDRLLAEAFLAGVYVENSPKWCPGLTPAEGTRFGGVVKRLSQLPGDLIRWSSELTTD